jgi:Zn-dependent protease
MLYRLPALLVAIVFHEYAHAQAADALGDPTPRYSGRLTLNPLAHLDPVGLLALWFFRFGWAKPVPVNPYNFRDPRRGMVLVAMAGPAMNLFLAFLTMLVLRLTGVSLSAAGPIVSQLLLYNVLLAAFNIIPVPPLDGSKILAGLLPRSAGRYIAQIEPYGWVVLLALLWTGILQRVIGPVVNLIILALELSTGGFIAL